MSQNATMFSPNLAMLSRLPPPMPPMPAKATLSLPLAYLDSPSVTPPAAQNPTPASAACFRKVRRDVRRVIDGSSCWKGEKRIVVGLPPGGLAAKGAHG